MNEDGILILFRDSVVLILKLSAPLLIVSMLVGLIIAIFQAATQIHEQTLAFVPKIIVIAVLLLAMGSWMLTNLSDFFNNVLQIAAGF